MDTIFALATARGRAGVAIVRVSGPDAFMAARHMAGTLPEPRQGALRRLRDRAGEVLDDALILCFRKGASFTGEDVVEFHLHGSPAIISAVLGTLSEISGLRLAEPGEFTRRALENGRLDLAQVEGLADLIEAETEAQRKQAQRVFAGDLGRLVGVWRTDLIRAAALLEATIDFADEDIPVDVMPEVLELLNRTESALKAESDGSRISERIRDGFEVALIGKPNVGKSTLLNRLAGREAAITSETAGTTRDVIEVRMDIKGLAVTFLDTAGIRAAGDSLEAEGVKRAMSRAREADIRVFLLEEGQSPDIGIEPQNGDIMARSKSDLYNNNNGLGVSGRTGAGVDLLLKQISETLELRVTGAATATRQRHRSAIDTAINSLVSARLVIEKTPEMAEVVAEEVRTAVRALDCLIGLVDVENILDEIFASFCLGK